MKRRREPLGTPVERKQNRCGGCRTRHHRTFAGTGTCPKCRQRRILWRHVDYWR